LNLVFPFARQPETAISPSTNIGECWACESSACNLTLRLSKAIAPSAFSIDHISQAIAHNISSAPRAFRVWGIEVAGENLNVDTAQIRHVLLGNFMYDVHHGKQVQTFYRDGDDLNESFKWIKLEILSNYGHDEYTCLYRFRIHSEKS